MEAGLSLKWVDKKFLNNKDLVREACKHDGLDLQYADEARGERMLCWVVLIVLVLGAVVG